jgi:hypothetical protein
MDGTEMPGVREGDEEQCMHVDTSCYLLHRSAFDVLRVWTTMPRPLSPVCDRVFLAAIREQRLPMAFTRRPTVAFRSQYACHYLAAGLPAPEGAKHDIGVAERDWLSSPEGVQETVRALGFYPLL